MATEKIMMGINLRKNKNTHSTGFGKYYPEVDVQKTLSLRGFAEHMTEHNSFYPRNIVEGVLNQIVVCLPELLAQGVPVKLGSLGTFYPTAQVEKDAAVPTIAAMKGLSPSDVVKAIHIRFLPDSSKLDNLCGPAFKNACTMEFRNIVDTQELTIQGKRRKVQTLKPIATAVAELDDESNPTQGGGTNTPSGNTGDDTGGGGGDNNNGGDDD